MDTTGPLERLALAVRARRYISAWSASAQALTLLVALDERGWTRLLAEPRDLDALADFSGLPLNRVRDLVAVLDAHGIAEWHDGKVRLSPPFEALSADDAWVGLRDVLDQSIAMSQLVRSAAVMREEVSLTEAEALTIACVAGGRTTRVTVATYEKILAELPELREKARAGRYLDVGCGIAGATLTMATMFPEMRAVAVEIVPAIAGEATCRAMALGVWKCDAWTRETSTR
ncbi:hypothetical protein ACFQ1L_35385 [Phytohabitans flavus]|uniref:hypothetical protein n=1 Tax=Phytohabitans flavus TaxID=1076124 RepID=UPI0015653BF7|nr:hypothetical protein [Phytohabitans flavus]